MKETDRYMKRVKELGRETVYYDDTMLNYDQINYLNNRHDFVEPEDATECIIREVRNGECIRHTYGLMNRDNS